MTAMVNIEGYHWVDCCRFCRLCKIEIPVENHPVYKEYLCGYHKEEVSEYGYCPKFTLREVD